MGNEQSTLNLFGQTSGINLHAFATLIVDWKLPMMMMGIIGFYTVWKLLKKLILSPLILNPPIISYSNGEFLSASILRGISSQDKVALANRYRKVGDLPPVYPNGWYYLLGSFELKPGDVRMINALGLNLCLFRGKDKGEAFILDAYCPHLGANLSVGGQVEGNCLKCPFHGWKFRGLDGQCVDIPNSNKVPRGASVKNYTSTEINGAIYLWYDAESREPQYALDKLEAIDGQNCRLVGTSEHLINWHIQDYMENSADIEHFEQLHLRCLRQRIFFSMFEFRYISTWNPSELETHKANGELKFKARLRLPAWMRRENGTSNESEGSFFKTAHFVFEQVGPSILQHRIQVGTLQMVMFQVVLPFGPLLYRQRIHLWLAPPGPTNWCALICAKAFLYITSQLIVEDFIMWNNKMWKSNPLLVKNDQHIAKYRRWYSQFYSENSPTLKSLKKKTVSW